MVGGIGVQLTECFVGHGGVQGSSQSLIECLYLYARDNVVCWRF
jgi:hypothetical protein